jgi:hypothetical protein
LRYSSGVSPNEWKATQEGRVDTLRRKLGGNRVIVSLDDAVDRNSQAGAQDLTDPDAPWLEWNIDGEGHKAVRSTQYWPALNVHGDD